MTITPTQAENLARRFRDVTRMVREKSAFHLPVDTSPRAALEGYLQACKVCGVHMHNEHWEEEAEAVVEELTARRRAAWAKLLRGA
jgi:hypothetical protein